MKGSVAMVTQTLEQRKKRNKGRGVQALLAKELKRLKDKLGVGDELLVEWLPGHKRLSDGRELRGEIRGTTILLYDEELEKAKETLKHELVEWLLDQTTEPYRRLANLLIKSIELEAYLKRETVVKKLEKLLT